jgi:hypothetical protein
VRVSRERPRRSSLRTRLVAAFTGLVLALAGLGTWSTWHLWQMDEVAGRILADNYLSVDAAQQMRDSLERLDADRRVARASLAPPAAIDEARTGYQLRPRITRRGGSHDEARSGPAARRPPR